MELTQKNNQDLTHSLLLQARFNNENKFHTDILKYGKKLWRLMENIRKWNKFKH